jgi:hypothetical protein
LRSGLIQDKVNIGANQFSVLLSASTRLEDFIRLSQIASGSCSCSSLVRALLHIAGFTLNHRSFQSLVTTYCFSGFGFRRRAGRRYAANLCSVEGGWLEFARCFRQPACSIRCHRGALVWSRSAMKKGCPSGNRAPLRLGACAGRGVRRCADSHGHSSGGRMATPNGRRHE